VGAGQQVGWDGVRCVTSRYFPVASRSVAATSASADAAVATQGFDLCAARRPAAPAETATSNRQLLLPGLCASPAMMRVVEQIQRLQQRATVLITGESGTGKELVARAIHVGSPGLRVFLPYRTTTTRDWPTASCSDIDAEVSPAR
jgi:transcriptional regulator with AAA-type ATPase domain